MVVALVEVFEVVVGCEKVEGIGLYRSICQLLVVLLVSLGKVLEEDRLTLEAGSTAGHPLAPPLTFVAVAVAKAVAVVVGARTVVAVASAGSIVVVASVSAAGGRGAVAVVAGGAGEKVGVDHEEQRGQEGQKRVGGEQKEKEEKREKG